MTDKSGFSVPASLAPLVGAYERQISAHLAQNKHYWTDTLGTGGSFSNFESSFVSGMAYMAEAIGVSDDTPSGSQMGAGCVAVSGKTLAIVNKHKPKGWKSSRLSVGYGMEHHAVILWREGSKWRSGIVFDAWVEQKPKIMSYRAWLTEFSTLAVIKGPRVANEN